MFASLNNYTEIVCELLKEEADPNVKNEVLSGTNLDCSSDSNS